MKTDLNQASKDISEQPNVLDQKRNPLPGVPPIESPFFERIFADETDPEFMRVACSLYEEGYAVIEFPEAEFDSLVERILSDLGDRYDWSSWNEGQGHGPRIADAWRFQKDVHRIAANSVILDLLSKLYGRRAFPFQTINFPVGTQQHFHSDSIHFSSMPERYMCGVWVAFEDVDENNGPLEYYPKSHRLPIYLNEALDGMPDWENNNANFLYNKRYLSFWEELVEAYQLEKREFHPRKGQAIIWAANLLHGGAQQKDAARTRHSQVTHYLFDNCAYYTPMLSAPSIGAIAYRNSLIDISTGAVVENRVGSLKVPHYFIEAALNAGNRFATGQHTSQDQLQLELQETQKKLQDSLQQIEAMKNNKLWKILQSWNQLKSAFQAK